MRDSLLWMRRQLVDAIADIQAKITPLEAQLAAIDTLLKADDAGKLKVTPIVQQPHHESNGALFAAPIEALLTPQQLENVIVKAIEAIPDFVWTTRSMLEVLEKRGYQVAGKNLDAKINTVLISMKALVDRGFLKITQMGRGRRPTLFVHYEDGEVRLG